METQIEYMSKLRDFIPEEKRNKYCLLFGNKILFMYDTLDEALEEQKKSPVLLALYVPYM